MSADNPYEAGRSEENLEANVEPSVPIGDEPIEEIRANIGSLSWVVKAVATFCALGCLYSLSPIWYAFQQFGLPSGWVLLESIGIPGLVLAACWAFAVWALWRYSQQLDATVESSLQAISDLVDRQALAWIAIGLLILMLLVNSYLTWLMTRWILNGG